MSDQRTSTRSTTADDVPPVTDASTCCAPGCCADQETPARTESQTESPGVAVDSPPEARAVVREGYGRIARGETRSCCGAGSADGLARGVGYDDGDLDGLPDGANLGLSCGNPTAVASLTEGDVVLDLGAGAGFDVFIAARKVGPRGRVIGVDMTVDMIDRARRNAVTHVDRTGVDNVEFRLGEIEHLPVADRSIDVVLSNCVINLSPDKQQVWKEIARVLKPGGRVAVSDIALKRELPDAVRASVQALVGCVAGAVLLTDTERMVHEAGLVDLEIEMRDSAIVAMEDWHDPLYREVAAGLPEGTTGSDFVTSATITARRPLEDGR
jgi:arsenite methyltransferase